MEIKTGMIVKSMSGHDKGSFYVVVSNESGTPCIADGRRRKVEKPKKKNSKHLAVTKTTIDFEQTSEELTNKKLRNILHSFNFRVENTAKDEGV